MGAQTITAIAQGLAGALGGLQAGLQVSANRKRLEDIEKRRQEEFQQQLKLQQDRLDLQRGVLKKKFDEKQALQQALFPIAIESAFPGAQAQAGPTPLGGFAVTRGGGVLPEDVEAALGQVPSAGEAGILPEPGAFLEAARGLEARAHPQILAEAPTREALFGAVTALGKARTAGARQASAARGEARAVVGLGIRLEARVQKDIDKFRDLQREMSDLDVQEQELFFSEEGVALEPEQVTPEVKEKQKSIRKFRADTRREMEAIGKKIRNVHGVDPITGEPIGKGAAPLGRPAPVATGITQRVTATQTLTRADVLAIQKIAATDLDAAFDAAEQMGWPEEDVRRAFEKFR